MKSEKIFWKKRKKNSNKMKEIEKLNNEKQYYDNDISKNDMNLENLKKDTNVRKIEDHITRNITNVLEINKLKPLVFNFFLNNKTFDAENEINVIVVQKLKEKNKRIK